MHNASSANNVMAFGIISQLSVTAQAFTAAALSQNQMAWKLLHKNSVQCCTFQPTNQPTNQPT